MSVSELFLHPVFLINIIPLNVNLVHHADDIVIYYADKNLLSVVHVLSFALNGINVFLNDRNLFLAEQKTKLVLFFYFDKRLFMKTQIIKSI